MNNFLTSKQGIFKKFFFMFALGICMMLLLKTPASAHESESPDTVIIHITPFGYQPNKINIRVGSNVIFENQDIYEHWPASDDHPSHSLYDGSTLSEHCFSENNKSFDSCKKIKTGESWAFRFDKPGEYKYHDHLWTQFKGEIIVSEIAPEKTPTRLERFVDFVKQIYLKVTNFFGVEDKSSKLETGSITREEYENLKSHYIQIVDKYDPREAIGELKEKSKGSQKLTSICHDLTHAIGRSAYKKYGNFKKASQYQEYFCNSGYLHGVFEAYFDSLGKLPSDIKGICNDYGGERNYLDIWQCQHGSGHASMYITGGDINKSINLCKTYADDINGTSACQSGVFMELFNSEFLSEESDFINPNQPSDVCEKTSLDDGKTHCYFSLPTYYSQNLNMNFDMIFGECQKIKEDKYIDTCMKGVGAEVAKRNIENIENVFLFCAKAPTYSNQAACIGGVVVMQMHHMGSFYAGLKLCDIVPSGYQNACFKAAYIERPVFEDENFTDPDTRQP